MAVGIHAEVVEQLTPRAARDAFLTYGALVHGEEPLRRPPARRRAGEVLDEVDIEGLPGPCRRAVINEVDAGGRGGEPGEDRLCRAVAHRSRAGPRLSVVSRRRRCDASVVGPRVPNVSSRVDRDVREIVVEAGRGGGPTARGRPAGSWRRALG